MKTAENVSEKMSCLAGIRSGLSVISENLDTINALVKKAHKQVGELLEDMEFTTQVNVTVKV